MKNCNLCDGAGVRQEKPPYRSDPNRRPGDVSPPGLTKALWPWKLCQCVVAELGALRTALMLGGLLPPEHWERRQPPRGAASVPPELNYLVLSVRRDGYRIISQRLEPHGTVLHAIAPDGAGVFDGNGERLWWARVEDAERSIDRNYPLPDDDDGPCEGEFGEPGQGEPGRFG